MKHTLVALGVISVLLCAGTATTQGRDTKGEKSGFVTGSDGARIHYVEVGPLTAGNAPHPSLLLVPGWTMPAWIWQKQIDSFAPNYRVVAMDPRCQGESSQTSDGLYPAQMARDINSVIDQLHLAPVVLVGWSMAVAEVGAYVDQFGTGKLAGIVLVDGGFGDVGRPGTDFDLGLLHDVLTNRQNETDSFIRQICFKRPQPEDYLEHVIQSSMKMPTNSAVAALAGYFSANYWPALAKFNKPTLIIGAKSSSDTDLIEEHNKIAGSRLVLLDKVGHALFVDDPQDFNSNLDSFLAGLK